MRRGIWSQTRMFAAGFGAFIGLAVGLVTHIAFGVYLIAVFVTWPWPRPEMYPLGTGGEKSATFMRALAPKLRKPWAARIGFGNPGENPESTRTKWPPARLSSWWGLFVAVWVTWAIAVGYGAAHDALNAWNDTRPEPINIPFLPGERFPALGVLAIFLLWQSVAAVLRATKDEAEPSPAAMFRSATLDTVFGGTRRFIVLSLGLTALAVGAGAAIVFLGFPPLLAPVPWMVVAAGISATYGNADLRAWREEIAKRQEWQQRWLSIPKLTAPPPVFVAEHLLPAGKEPTHAQATFAVPGGSDFSKYEPVASALATALGSDMVLINPMPRTDAEGNFIPGYAQEGAFVVTWALTPMGRAPHLNGEMDQRTLSFALRHAFKQAFVGLKLGAPEFAGATSLAMPNSGRLLLETRWRLPAGVTFEQVTKMGRNLQEKIGADWLRVGRRSVEQPDGRIMPSEYVSIVYGDHPDHVPLRQPASETRRFLDSLEWDAAFRACGVSGTSGGTPRLLEKVTSDRGITEITFQCGDGLSVASVSKTVPELASTLGVGYVAVERLNDSGAFRVLTGDTDPLDRMYQFMDYDNALLSAPVRGAPRLDWVTGIDAVGAPLTYKWDEELPHLLCAGGSGMGKSSVLNNMILQMAHNCHPDDLRFWMAEPKNELQQFAHMAHTERFLDLSTPGNLYENAANLFRELRTEMDRRYTQFTRHPANPLKLSDARLVARTEGPQPDGKPHPLELPYIVCIIEECASFFSPPSAKKNRGFHEEIIDHVTELSRKARASGIYLVAATQYPTNASIPSTIRQQMRRIGLGVSTQIASMVVIDEPGLEEINKPGRGMMSVGKGYRQFRAFYLRKPDEDHPDEPDDRRTLLARIPHIEGRTFGGGGEATNISVPPIPPGVWD